MKFGGLNREGTKHAKKTYKKLRELRSIAVNNKSQWTLRTACKQGKRLQSYEYGLLETIIADQGIKC